jgi:hypothetical protein
MEKIIIGGIALWISFIFPYGFPPPKPVKHPDKQKIEISKPDPINPKAVEYKWNSRSTTPS